VCFPSMGPWFLTLTRTHLVADGIDVVARSVLGRRHQAGGGE
jgi:hypothetical protein